MEPEQIVKELPRFEEAARDLRDILLANLVLIGEIPAPTFSEEARVAMITQRFNECRLQNCSVDERGNGAGVLPGKSGERRILVTAHADSLVDAELDHTIGVREGEVAGRGVSDNSLGLAALASLPTLLEKLEIHLDSDLVFLADAHSLGRGNLDGIRFFLKNAKQPIDAGLCLEGVSLDRLNYMSVGMMRGEITCEVPAKLEWGRYGVTNAVEILNEVIHKILEIPVPQRPPTSITIGEISGGQSFNQIPRDAHMRFEVRSEKPGLTAEIRRTIEDICSEITSMSGVQVNLDVVATRQMGGLPFRHPLPQTVRRVHEALGIRTKAGPSVSELAEFIARDIPAVTIGITNGRHLNTRKETLEIEPMFKGLAQTVAILLAIDGGICEKD